MEGALYFSKKGVYWLWNVSPQLTSIWDANRRLVRFEQAPRNLIKGHWPLLSSFASERERKKRIWPPPRKDLDSLLTENTQCSTLLYLL